MTDALRLRLQTALGGAYVLDAELAGGGMSRVFVGRETALGRRIVLKVLPPEVATREPIARFQREAMLAAQLQHPHIVPVFAVGEVDDIRYFTMPFINGESLRARLERRHALPASEASRVLREIGGALAAVHRHGVVHRDVKPENIFIERGTERAMLADFGVALALGEPEGVTQAGVTVGTPAYMSPEQVDGLRVDGLSDVYSLGLVGWEMLTGERPWSGESFYDVMHKQKYVLLPPLDAFKTDASPNLVRAIDRAVRKDPRTRWPSAEAFVTAIDGEGDAVPAATGPALSADWPAAARTAADTRGDLRGDTRDDTAAQAATHANAPTVVSRARRSSGRGAARTSAGVRPSFSYVNRAGRERATRWTRAIPAAIVVLLIGVAAAAGATGTGGWSFPAWLSAASDAATSAPAGTAESIVPAIDTVAAIHVARGLTGTASDTRVGAITARVLPSIPAAARVVNAPVIAPIVAPTVASSARHAPHAYSHAQPGNSVRARVATAELSLHTYERIMASASSVHESRSAAGSAANAPVSRPAGTPASTPAGTPAGTRASSAPSAAPVIPPANIPNGTPAAAGNPPLAPAIPSAPSGGSSQDLPAPAPADPHPPAATSSSVISAASASLPASGPAAAVRVPPASAAAPTGSAASPAASPSCQPPFPGSHVCRVYDARTGRVVEYQYVPERGVPPR